MLDEVECAAWAQHAAYLSERLLDVGDGAQRPRGEHVVDTGGVEVKLLAVQSCVLDAYRARGLTDLQWGTASGKPDERFVYLAPSGPRPTVDGSTARTRLTAGG